MRKPFHKSLKAPGDPLSAEEWNRLQSAVVTSVEGDGNTIIAHRGSNRVILEALLPRFSRIHYAEIDTDHGDGTYSATEVKADGSVLSDARGWGTSGDLDRLNALNGERGISGLVAVERRSDTNGDPYWVILGSVSGSSSSPATIGSTGESESADAGTWDRSSQGANDGVTVTAMTRMAYDDAGDETLYAFYRNFTYDSRGMLSEVSDETRVAVDTPEAC